ncbi:trypsin-like peptidase domain-containing protein [Streptomyces sp. NA04227]|uniref:VMAP-C domain-containing protein n=1 Tax=Streptomyces sp. NA04227 TaxID=2742136 RepID=UPI0015924DB4|nr:trypsin-like peptidase domain-containing protein [Streptomyces sp. NA04227]QKW09123.1 trypsin-like peptidase domain-containing protein [Streptomyces sp. NA04227]
MPEPDPRLDTLARAATVHLLDGGAKGDGAMWGSGFFVAPGLILTCAHVLAPEIARDPERQLAVRGADFNDGIPVAARLAFLPEAARRTLRASPEGAHLPLPPEQDLALLRLVEADVPHECVWLADRALRHIGDVVAYGYQPQDLEPWAKPWSADAEINVRDGDWGLRFKPEVSFPKGVSGGPLLDPYTGAVVGLIKSRRKERDGGMAVALPALRQFKEIYGEVMDGHDRWHGGPSGGPTGYTWAGEQHRLARGDAHPGPDRWTAKDRRRALRLLAELAPPATPLSVAKLVRKVRGGRIPGTLPALHTWRDGHGLLYDTPQPGDMLPFLHYLRLVAEYVRCRGGDTGRLEEFVTERLAEDERTALHALVTDARLPAELRPLPGDGDRVVVRYPGPGQGPTVTVLLDPVIGSRPTRFHWQIWVNEGAHGGEREMTGEDYSGEGVLPRDLLPALREPLRDTLAREDAEGAAVPLEIALPAEHFDLQAHRWHLEEVPKLYETARLGTQRCVVLRDLARRGAGGNPAEPDGAGEAGGTGRDWADRWQRSGAAREWVAQRVPERDREPRGRYFHGLAATSVPVMCRPAGRGLGRKVMRLALDSGHGMALWDIEGHAVGGCHADCEDLHAGVERLFGDLCSPAELPDRLRHIRHDISRGHDGLRWAEPVALLYDDPDRPLPPEDAEPADSPP